MCSHTERGLTLMEIMLSMALLSIVTTGSYVLYVNVAQKGQMDTVTREVATLMQRAIALARAGEGDSEWGIYMDQPYTVLFKGSSFESRDESFDEKVTLPDFELSGTMEYIFARVTGFPQEAGAVTFTNEQNGDVRTILINEKGTISIE